MPHLHSTDFSGVFEPLQGKTIGFVRPIGNVGDHLIEQATRQLFDRFEIRWRLWNPGQPLEDLEELVFGGGGNMGETYRCNWEMRAACLETGLPVTILPQSYLGPEDRPFHRVYVRETASFRFCPQDAILAPDLALGLTTPAAAPASEPLGILLRNDVEARQGTPWYSRDPVQLARTPDQYLRLAASYETLITDRLHLAIAGLLQDRHVILLPNSYFKNTSMHETWLASLGCGFALTLAEALEQTDRKSLNWRFQTRHFLTATFRKVLNDWQRAA